MYSNYRYTFVPYISTVIAHRAVSLRDQSFLQMSVIFRARSCSAGNKRVICKQFRSCKSCTTVSFIAIVKSTSSAPAVRSALVGEHGHRTRLQNSPGIPRIRNKLLLSTQLHVDNIIVSLKTFTTTQNTVFQAASNIIPYIINP